MMRKALFVALALVFAFPLYAGNLKSTSDDRKDLSVTVYNQNLGLVREVRVLSLPSGTVALEFQDVASGIDAKTVRVEALGGLSRFEVLEQNFEFDLMSPEKLMEKYVGKGVELVIKHPQTGVESTLQAELLSMRGGPIYRIEGKIHVGHPGRVVLPSIPENLIPRPTLVWLIDAKEGKGEVEVTYLTSGMGWRADYVALLDDKDRAMDVTGWVTLTNTSGAGFENARLKLVAGEVHRVEEKKLVLADRERRMEAVALKEGMIEEPFFEYHLYTLPRRTTIKDNQTKQVELLSSKDVGVLKEYVLPPNPRFVRYRTAHWEPVKENVVINISFENVKKNNLGVPLPAGIFRFYKKDSEGSIQLVGEDGIVHVPEGEKVSMKLGEAFDIVAERIMTDYEVIKKDEIFEYGIKVTIRNAKDEDVTVNVLDQFRGEWRILSSSHETEKKSASIVSFSVPVPGKGASELTYRVRIEQG